MADAQEGGIVASAWLQQELNRKCPIDIGVLASTLHWSKEEEADKVQACEHEAAPPPPAQKHAAHAHFHSGASCPDGYEFKTVTTTFAGCFRPGETPAAGQPVVVATPLQAPAPAVPK